MTEAETPFISVAILACNDEDHIVRTLDSIKTVADEFVIILDTKSEDRTEALIRAFAESLHDESPLGSYWETEGGRIKLFKCPWTHSFSQARNRAIEHCTGTWIIAMDADEELCAADQTRLVDGLKTAEEMGTDMVQCLLVVNPTYETPTQFDTEFGDFCSIHNRTRIMRNSSGPFYKNRVHEQPNLGGVDLAEWREDFLDVRFFHRGDLTSGKTDYYRALLTLDLMDQPCDPVPAIYLADIHMKDRKQERARQLLEGVDITPLEKGRNRPIASQWHAVMGKVQQVTWAKRKQEMEAEDREMSDLEISLCDEIAKDSIVAFEKAWDLQPMYVAAGIQAAVMRVISQGKPGAEEAAIILSTVLKQDEMNVVAGELLAFVSEFLKNAEGEQDNEVVLALYQQLISKIGVYLQDMSALEHRRNAEANGLDGSIDSVSLERLKTVRA